MYDVERIGKLRKQLGLTQKGLADMSGVSQSLIAKMESGRIDPAYSKVMQVISALESERSKGKKTAQDIMSPQIVAVAPSDLMQKAISLMRNRNISQVPVFEDGKCVGNISDSKIVDLIATAGTDLKCMKVREAMGESFPVIPSSSIIDVVADLLKHYRAVLVEKNGKISGIITKADLFKAI